MNKENVKVKFTDIRADRLDVIRKPASEPAGQTAMDGDVEFDEANPQY